VKFELERTTVAIEQLAALENDNGLFRQLKAVRKALGYMQSNINHPSLNVYPYRGKTCPHGDTLFEAYAQNDTPAAHRIFFCYPPNERGKILVVAITKHP
jgi:hypothetical protein